jgi:hypothetical protein
MIYGQQHNLDRGDEWRKEQDTLLGPASAAQECDCDFLTSGTGVIDATLLENLRKRDCKDPLEKRGIDDVEFTDEVIGD